VTSQKALHVLKVSKPALWTSQLPNKWKSGAPPPGTRWPSSGVNLTTRL